MPGQYFQPIRRIFLNLSGGTVTGDTVFTQGVYALNLSGDTIYSGGTNLSDIILQLSIGATSGMTSGFFLPLTGGTGGQYYFTGNTTGQTIFVEQDFIPTIDNNSDLGSTIKRFRNLNTVNGVVVNFTAETRIVAPQIELGTVILTDTSVVLTGNTLDGGDW